MTLIVHEPTAPFYGLGHWYSCDTSHFACCPYFSPVIPNPSDSEQNLV